MPQPHDFARELNEQPSPATPSNTDLQLGQVQIPPDVPARGANPSGPQVLPSQTPPLKTKKKSSKAPLLLLPLLALGAVGFWMQRRASQAQSENAPAASSSVKSVAATRNGAGSAGKARLKALWQQGAGLKRRGDFAGARRVWEQGLKLDPQNKGFSQSIGKLPRVNSQNNAAANR